MTTLSAGLSLLHDISRDAAREIVEGGERRPRNCHARHPDPSFYNLTGGI
eukprot:CAMPEP_0202816846 /NCGR_PEP_ID=MMETSP1389-20130828/7221_1 /ASSEMBLY_ACC=CAM_ASM_000865 /TAXON_ID=302021 /ORGANISM="Rhodomonas sp., Strain CCMP768" /LENGTH=49 /DNA_ID= /DNA_START= /DNA_END= /DNA_ORIENTATION=